MKSILNFLFFLAIASMFLGSAMGATIHGSIYSYDLEKIANALVEVNSTPKQTLFTTNGDYSFELPIGIYRITAVSKDGSEIQRADEMASVYDGGSYNIDLFLMTVIEDDYENLSININLDAIPEKHKDALPYPLKIAIPAILFAIAGIIIGFIRRRKLRGIGIASDKVNMSNKDNVDSEGNGSKNRPIPDIKNAILEEIGRMDGRATQKELRKKIPYSESKISLVVTELEHEKKIRKIKKGRGNILIINK